MRANKLCAILGSAHEYPDLLPLTENRPMAMLPFNCKYRIIDFHLSNVVNAHVKSLFMVFNNGKMRSVIDHIHGGKEWHLDSVDRHFSIHFYQDFLQQQAEGKQYYETLIDYLRKSRAEYVVFISNRMVCNIDLTAVLNIHKSNDHAITTVYKKVPRSEAADFDVILKNDTKGGVVSSHSFAEDPGESELVNLCMNIFFCKTEWLIQELTEGQKQGTPVSIQDFLTRYLTECRSAAYEYTGFLSNIFSVASYYRGNMAMLDPQKMAALFYSSNQIYTKTKNEAVTYYAPASQVFNSQFATGCLVAGAVENSLLSRLVQVEKTAEIRDAVVMANTQVKAGAKIRHAILDKNVIVDEGVELIGSSDKPIVITKGTHVTKTVYGGEKA